MTGDNLMPTNTIGGADYVVTMARDGDQWCALIGGDLQSGRAGFGATPADSLRALADEWEQGESATLRARVDAVVAEVEREIAKLAVDTEQLFSHDDWRDYGEDIAYRHVLGLLRDDANKAGAK